MLQRTNRSDIGNSHAESLRPSQARRHPVLMAFVGALLLGSAIAVLLPLKPQLDKQKPGYSYNTLPRLSGWHDPRLQRLDGESDLELMSRLTQVVHGAVFHCGPNDYRDLASKWVLAQFFGGPDRQGFLNPALINCGYCHQLSYILAHALERQSIRAQTLGLNGHVVTLIHHGNQRYIADADIGIAPIPYDEALWSHARPLYEQISWIDDELLRQLSHIVGTVSDDDFYYSMNFLKQHEQRQNRLVRLSRALAAVIGMFGAALLGSTLFAFRTTRSASRDNAGTLQTPPGAPATRPPLS